MVCGAEARTRIREIALDGMGKYNGSLAPREVPSLLALPDRRFGLF